MERDWSKVTTTLLTSCSHQVRLGQGGGWISKNKTNKTYGQYCCFVVYFFGWLVLFLAMLKY